MHNRMRLLMTQNLVLFEPQKIYYSILKIKFFFLKFLMSSSLFIFDRQQKFTQIVLFISRIKCKSIHYLLFQDKFTFLMSQVAYNSVLPVLFFIFQDTLIRYHQSFVQFCKYHEPPTNQMKYVVHLLLFNATLCGIRKQSTYVKIFSC